MRFLQKLPLITKTEDEKKIIHPFHLKILVVILLLTLVVRLGAMITLQTWKIPDKWSFGYLTGEIAYALATGQGYSWPKTESETVDYATGVKLKREAPVPTSWEAPIYTSIVAAAFWLFGPYSAGAAVVIELFQIFISLLTCLFIFLLGSRVFNVWIGLIASFIYAFYLPAVHFSIQKIGYETLYVFFILLFIFQFLRLVEAPSLKKSVLTGFLFGVTALTCPIIFSFLPFAVGWYCLTSQTNWISRLKYSSVIMLVLFATISPWLVRNYMVFDRFVFIKSNFSRALVMSNYGAQSISRDDLKSISEGDDGEMSAFFQKKAVVLIINNQQQFLHYTVDRFVKFWTGNKGMRGRNKADWIKNTAGAICYFTIAGSGLVGIIISFRRRGEVQLLNLFIFSMPLPFYITWTSNLRYRLPVEIMLILFSGFFIYELLKRLRLLRLFGCEEQ